MPILTLYRRAPLSPGVVVCRLCSASIAGQSQDQLLVGQPGMITVEAAICQRCGETLQQMIDVFGPELSIVVREHPQPVDHLIGGPADRSRIARAHDPERLEPKQDTDLP